MTHGRFSVRRGALMSAVLVACSLSLTGLVTGCGGAAASGGGANSANNPLIGQKAPDFSLPAQFGADGSLSPSNASGKVLIVDFWATWCAPCKDSFPAYQKLVNHFGDKLMVIGVSVDDDPSGIKAFAKDTGVSFPLAWDKGQVVAGKYKPGTMPTSYIIDQNGIIRFVHSGFHAGDEKELQKQIQSLM